MTWWMKAAHWQMTFGGIILWNEGKLRCRWYAVLKLSYLNMLKYSTDHIRCQRSSQPPCASAISRKVSDVLKAKLVCGHVLACDRARYQEIFSDVLKPNLLLGYILYSLKQYSQACHCIKNPRWLVPHQFNSQGCSCGRDMWITFASDVSNLWCI